MTEKRIKKAPGQQNEYVLCRSGALKRFRRLLIEHVITLLFLRRRAGLEAEADEVVGDTILPVFTLDDPSAAGHVPLATRECGSGFDEAIEDESVAHAMTLAELLDLLVGERLPPTEFLAEPDDQVRRDFRLRVIEGTPEVCLRVDVLWFDLMRTLDHLVHVNLSCERARLSPPKGSE